jgi:UDP-sugar transporter A1/2/3
MHYSQTMPPINGQRYHASTAVFLNEVFKLAISLTLALYEIMVSPEASQSTTILGIFEELASAVFTGDSWKMAIPAVLYTMQNSLQYFAAGNLDAATFQVTSQLKVLTTAVFSVILLGRVLDIRKWLSLVLLMVGVAVASYPVGFSGETVLTIKELRETLAPHPPRNIWDLKALGNAAAGQLTKRSATYEGIDEDFANQNPRVQASVGLIALTTACVLSGLAGVYFEKILKEPKKNVHTPSVWVRNVQLSFYSLWPALFIGVLFKDGEHIARDGFFAGYNSVVWTAVVMQALGGITVALVIKYADNIAKNFATSFSIILSFLASVSLFDFEITSLVSVKPDQDGSDPANTAQYLLGTATVLGATYLYSTAETRASNTLRPPPINVSEYRRSGEKSYFDLESIASVNRSPLPRGEAFSSSRPSTPSYERRPVRMKSSEHLSANKRA